MLLLFTFALACPPSAGPHLELEGGGDCILVETPADPSASDDMNTPGVDVWLPLGEEEEYLLAITNVCSGTVTTSQLESSGALDLDILPGERVEVEITAEPESSEQGYLVEVDDPNGTWVLVVKNTGGSRGDCDASQPSGCQHTAWSSYGVDWFARRRQIGALP